MNDRFWPEADTGSLHCYTLMRDMAMAVPCCPSICPSNPLCIVRYVDGHSSEWLAIHVAEPVLEFVYMESPFIGDFGR